MGRNHRPSHTHTHARHWATDLLTQQSPTTPNQPTNQPPPPTQEEKQSFDQNLFWGGVAFIAFTVVAFFVTIGLDVSYMLQGF